MTAAATKHSPSPTRRQLWPDLTLTGLRRCIRHLAIRTPALIRAAFITGAAQPVFYFLVLGLGLGSIIDGTRADAVGGNYLHFVGPGLLAASSVQWSFQEGLWPTASLLRWEHTYQAVATTPTTLDEIATSHVLWIALRMMAAAVPFTVVLAIFGAADSPWAITAPLVAALTCLSTAPWVSGFVAATENDIYYALVMRMGMFPMFIFSGAFFPLDSVPAFAEFLAKLFPAYHGVELSRAVTGGRLDGVALHITYLLLVAGAGWVYELRSFRAILDGSHP